MHVLGILVSVATLLHVALAQGELSGIALEDDELSQVFAQVPLCAVSSLFLPRSDHILTPSQQKCSLNTLVPAHCQLLDLASCLCTNTTLQ